MMIASFAVPLLLAGCSAAGTQTTGDTGTTAAVVTGAEPESPPLAPRPLSTEVRSVGWQAVIEAETGDDSYVSGQPLYSDFNGDGVEDALVPQYPVLGHSCSFHVYTYRNGAPVKLYTQAELFDPVFEPGETPDTFIMRTSLPEPDDPFCCPTNLRVRQYQWSDANQSFHVTGEWVEDNPDVD